MEGEASLRQIGWAKVTMPVDRVLRRLRQIRDVAIYSFWLNAHHPKRSELSRQVVASRKLKYTPLISVIVPTFNTPHRYFCQMVESVMAQTYSNWELIIVDDSSSDGSLKVLIESYSSRDSRIRFKPLKENLHIAGATNEGIKTSRGEFVSLLDHDDILQPNALFEVARALNKDEHLDFIFSDEDKVTEDGQRRHSPLLKPGWNLDFLRSVNYITHFATIRKALLEKVGYLDTRFNGAQDWELFFRIARGTQPEKIHHIPEVLYSWRTHPGSTSKDIAAKPYVAQAQKMAIDEDLRARGLTGYSLFEDPSNPGYWRITMGQQTNSHILVVILGEDTPEVREYAEGLTRDQGCKTMILDEHQAWDTINTMELEAFEFAVIVKGRPMDGQDKWLENMIGDMARKDVGFVLGRVTRPLDNLVGTLESKSLSLLGRLTRYGVSNKLYSTVRYNLLQFEYFSVVGIQLKKISFKDNNASDLPSFMRETSAKLSVLGCPSLYNPYLDVVEQQ